MAPDKRRMIGGRRPLQGRKPGDRRVRVERPHAPYFRYTGRSQLVAKRGGRPAAHARRPIHASSAASCSDARCPSTRRSASACTRSRRSRSSARTRSARRPTRPRRSCASSCSPGPARCCSACRSRSRSRSSSPSSRTSYRQVCGLSVGRRRLRRRAGEPARRSSRSIAAGALLVDYVMTVAVSTVLRGRAGHLGRPGLDDLRVEIAFVAIVLIMLGNLRGLRESGNIFAIPTYLFVGSPCSSIAIGLFRIVVLGEAHAVPPQAGRGPVGPEPLGALLLLRAFAAGSVALTGTEAIANGVPAFKPPEPKNAATRSPRWRSCSASCSSASPSSRTPSASSRSTSRRRRRVISQVAATSSATARRCSTCSRRSRH